jgi:type II secretory pathway component PulF
MMRYFKLLHQSGMNYVDILTLLRAIMGVGPYQDMLQHMLSHVQRGEQMHLGLIPYPYLVPANAAILLKVGEKTAQVPETLQNIIDIYEEDLLSRIAGVSKIIEPVLIVVL